MGAFRHQQNNTYQAGATTAPGSTSNAVANPEVDIHQLNTVVVSGVGNSQPTTKRKGVTGGGKTSAHTINGIPSRASITTSNNFSLAASIAAGQGQGPAAGPGAAGPQQQVIPSQQLMQAATTSLQKNLEDILYPRNQGTTGRSAHHAASSSVYHNNPVVDSQQGGDTAEHPGVGIMVNRSQQIEDNGAGKKILMQDGGNHHQIAATSSINSPIYFKEQTVTVNNSDGSKNVMNLIKPKNIGPIVVPDNKSQESTPRGIIHHQGEVVDGDVILSSNQSNKRNNKNQQISSEKSGQANAGSGGGSSGGAQSSMVYRSNQRIKKSNQVVLVDIVGGNGASGGISGSNKDGSGGFSINAFMRKQSHQQQQQNLLNKNPSHHTMNVLNSIGSAASNHHHQVSNSLRPLVIPAATAKMTTTNAAGHQEIGGRTASASGDKNAGQSQAGTSAVRVVVPRNQVTLLSSAVGATSPPNAASGAAGAGQTATMTNVTNNHSKASGRKPRVTIRDLSKFD